MANDSPLSKPSSGADVARFIRQARQLAPRGASRLLFALDATASRQPTWDRACQLQGEMFAAAAAGPLSVQLAWYRGFAEFYAESWAADAATLQRQMSRVQCAGGMTQIERVLRHAVDSSREQRLKALVFVGDCVEESPQTLYRLAGQLKLLGLPAFMFQEGSEPHAAACLREIAALSGGAYCDFDAASAERLRQLLRAVAVYASGGRRALQAITSANRAAALLERQLDRR